MKLLSPRCKTALLLVCLFCAGQAAFHPIEGKWQASTGLVVRLVWVDGLGYYGGAIYMPESLAALGVHTLWSDITFEKKDYLGYTVDSTETADAYWYSVLCRANSDDEGTWLTLMTVVYTDKQGKQTPSNGIVLRTPADAEPVEIAFFTRITDDDYARLIDERKQEVRLEEEWRKQRDSIESGDTTHPAPWPH